VLEVIGYVKPGSGMEVITDMAKKEITTLTKEDMVVIWGGANDIAKMKQITVSHITNFVNLRKHMNILIVGAPARFDLLSTSCVNEEVIAYNKKLHKKVKQFERVKIRKEENIYKYKGNISLNAECV
jgi:hypothetical protein